MMSDDDLLTRALGHIRKLKAENAAHRGAQASEVEPIAIVGMAFRLPGDLGELTSLSQLRDFLIRGADAVRPIDNARWPVSQFTVSSANEQRNGTSYSHVASQLSDPYHFDAPAFNMTAEEAKTITPQTRLLLEQCWFALADAGYPLGSDSGVKIGLTAGMTHMDYSYEQSGHALAALDAYNSLSQYPCVDVGRIAYALDLMGPVMLTDTACSSGLASVHTAMSLLKSGQADIMLAGASNMILGPSGMASMSALRGLSPTGHCRTFDAAADGYVRGEGVGAFVLKRYRDAVRDGDRIVARLCGSAMSCDGRSNGLTAPNPKAQVQVVRDALKSAGLTGDAIDFIEAHGTGTPIGDPVEVRALTTALQRSQSQSRRVLLGSIKANIGHLEAASGFAGLLKAICHVSYCETYPQLNYTQPNARIDLANGPFEISQSHQKVSDLPEIRTAGVSSFGISGTNVHVIVQNEPAAEPIGSADQLPLVMSAYSEVLLRSLAGMCAEWAQDAPADWASIVSSLTFSDQGLSVRRGTLVASRDELLSALNAWAQGGEGGEHGLQQDAGIAEYLDGQILNWRRQYSWPKGYRPHAPHAALNRVELRKACALTAFEPPNISLPLHIQYTELAPDGIAMAAPLSGAFGVWSAVDEPVRDPNILPCLAWAMVALGAQLLPSDHKAHSTAGMLLDDVNISDYAGLNSAAALTLQAVLSPADADGGQTFACFGQERSFAAELGPWQPVLQSACTPSAVPDPDKYDWKPVSVPHPIEVEQSADVRLGALDPTLVAACVSRVIQNLPLAMGGHACLSSADYIWVSHDAKLMNPQQVSWQYVVIDSNAEGCVCSLRAMSSEERALWVIEGLRVTFTANVVEAAECRFEPNVPDVSPPVLAAQGAAQDVGSLSVLTELCVNDADREQRLADYLEAQIVYLLKSDPDTRICRQSGLFSLGLTSLLALELRRNLERATGLAIDATATFNYPSIDALAGYLEDKLLAKSGADNLAVETKSPPRTHRVAARPDLDASQAPDDLSLPAEDDDLFRQLENLIAD